MEDILHPERRISEKLEIARDPSKAQVGEVLFHVCKTQRIIVGNQIKQLRVLWWGFAVNAVTMVGALLFFLWRTFG